MKKLLTALFALTATVCCVLFAAGCKNDGNDSEKPEGTYKLYSHMYVNTYGEDAVGNLDEGGITYYVGDCSPAYGLLTEDTMTFTLNDGGAAVWTIDEACDEEFPDDEYIHETVVGALTEKDGIYSFTATIEEEPVSLPVTVKDGVLTMEYEYTYQEEDYIKGQLYEYEVSHYEKIILKKSRVNQPSVSATPAEPDSLEKPQMPSGVEIPDAEGYNNVMHQIERACTAVSGVSAADEEKADASVNCAYDIYVRHESNKTDGGEAACIVSEGRSSLRYVNGGDGNTVARLNACNKYSDNDGNKTDLISVNVNGGAADAFVNGNLCLRTNDWVSSASGKNVPAAVSGLIYVTTVTPLNCLHDYLDGYLNYKYKPHNGNYKYPVGDYDEWQQWEQSGTVVTVNKAELTFKADADRYFAEYALEIEYKNGSHTSVEKTDFIFYMDAAAGLKAEDIKLQTASPENVENILYVDCDAAQLSAAVKAGDGLSLTLSGGATQGTVISYIVSGDKLWDSVDGVVTGDKIEFDAEELRQFVSALSPGDALELSVIYTYWQAPGDFAAMLSSVTRIYFTVE